MSQQLSHTPAVIVGAVPLFSVNKITLNEQFDLPPVTGTKLTQSTGRITRTVSIDAILIGAERHAIRLALEAIADLSRTLPAIQPIVNGIPLVAGLVTLLDMQVSSLTFGQSADEKDVTTVSISLKHCPRPGIMAAVSEAVNAAGAIAGTTVGVATGGTSFL